MAAVVADVTESEFVQTVVEGSKTRPVVVDFWAEWCGPCRQLSPALEQAAQEFAGEVDVVKVDVDANPRLAQQFGVQGIPAVKAFADGRVVKEFTGLQPPAAIQQFFAALAPSKADRLVTQATQEPDRAEELYRQALQEQSDHPGAAVGLAELLASADQVQAARDVLGKAPPTQPVTQMLATLGLQDAAAGDVDELRSRVAAGDDEARIDWGKALAAQGDHEAAISTLLDAVAVPATKEAGRDALLEVFTAMGNDHPLVKAARPRLAAALF